MNKKENKKYLAAAIDSQQGDSRRKKITRKKLPCAMNRHVVRKERDNYSFRKT